MPARDAIDDLRPGGDCAQRVAVAACFAGSVVATADWCAPGRRAEPAGARRVADGTPGAVVVRPRDWRPPGNCDLLPPGDDVVRPSAGARHVASPCVVPCVMPAWRAGWPCVAVLPSAEPVQRAVPPCAAALPCAERVPYVAPPCAVPPREVPRVARRVRPFRLRVEAAAARWRLLVGLCPVLLPAPGFWSFLSSSPPPVRNSVPSFNWLNGWRFINPAVTFSDVIEDECPVILGLQIPRAKIGDAEGNLSVRAAGVPGAQALN